MASMLMKPHEPADEKAKTQVKESLVKATEWLDKSKPSVTTQSLALMLFRDAQAGKTAKELQAGIASLLERQNKDGGWGQSKGLPSDAYATGQALYFLSAIKVEKDRAEIQRAVGFLISTQRKEGSWPMTSRAHPGEKPMTNPVPITYFGSAWATMGLMKSIGK
jgi:hypothetical protein